MPKLSVRTDEAMEKALATLTESGRTRAEAVRYALLQTSHREELNKRARTDADRVADAPADRAEMLAIQRYLGLAE